MRISVFGLGYVGCVTAACLAERGHQVIGVDIVPEKAALVNAGRSPVVEPGLDDLLEAGVNAGRLHATLDVACAVAASELGIVCVGTPSDVHGHLDTTHIQRVSWQIGQVLGTKLDPFTLVIRSTLLPGTTGDVIIPILQETTGRPSGQGYDVLYHPEFLREGNSLRDFRRPPLIVVGEEQPGAGQQLLDLYQDIEAPKVVTPIEVAEAIKYVSNAFHAVKITFANEIGQFCAAAGVDSQAVMEIFCQDHSLNISSAYLRPGFAWGGSCLPKDLRALLNYGEQHGVTLPMLRSMFTSNASQIERTMQRIQDLAPQRIGLVGLAFKPHTDDLRESQLVELARGLLGKGYPLRIYHPSVTRSQLIGSNKVYMEKRLPNLGRLLVADIADLDHCDLIVLGHHLVTEEVIGDWLEQGVRVLDLMGPRPATATKGKYIGLYW